MLPARFKVGLPQQRKNLTVGNGEIANGQPVVPDCPSAIAY
jgi:hypothetical protein